MQEWLHFIDRWFWLGMGAIGFAILFNVPKRTIFTIFLLGAFGGSLKFIVLAAGGGIILGSFFGAVLVGFASLFAAHYRHTPPFVFSHSGCYSDGSRGICLPCHAGGDPFNREN